MLRSPYRTAVMATKHDKASLIRPAFTGLLGIEIVEATVDTDVLGTFSGEVPRIGSVLETAVRKARMGMAEADLPTGIASEGTIGPSEANPFLTVARELLVLVDDERGIVIAETEVAYDLIAMSVDATPDQDLTAHLERARFPEHALVIRPADGPPTPIFKAVQDHQDLHRAVEVCGDASTNGRARIETDLRAHLCPSRRPIIARAAERLARRIARPCPTCGAPGFGPVRLELGVPCGWCGAPTETVRARVLGCAACPAEGLEPVSDGPADPGHCTWCNP